MVGRSSHLVIILFGLWFFLSFTPSRLWGQQNTQGPPPANVSVVKVKTGRVAPQSEFIATIFYQEISETASEISGLVEAVRFEEGQHLKKGQILVELGSDILRKRLQGAKASYEQALSELAIARINLKRRETLFQKKSISQQTYDENRYRVIGTEKGAASLYAQLEQIKIELEKKIIRAPFDGVVIKRHVDRGEWISEGESVAMIGKDDVIDIVAELPEQIIQYIKIGMRVKATANGKDFSGTVIAIVPKGDISTRTFPVKIRTPNQFSLIEGMSARVTLPKGEIKETLIVPRDAVLLKFGKNVVFVADQSKVTMLPVEIIGFEGLDAGVASPGLTEGMFVVVEGNERLRDGQAVAYKQPEDRVLNSEFGMRNAERKKDDR
jgi:RND family efflux transporter MFP subunit